MRTKYFLIIFLLLSLKSCKKEELNGDLTYLDGKWKLYLLINNSSFSVYPPNDEKTVYYLKFENSGRIILLDYENKIIERGRVISYTSSPSSSYINGIDYEIKIGSNAIFNRKLDNLISITLISTNVSPMEIITNDFREIYETSALNLVFQKM